MQTKSKVDFHEKLISEEHSEPNHTLAIYFFAKSINGF